MTLNISEQFQIGLWPMCKALPGSSHKQRDHTKAPWTKDRTGCILIILLCLPISIRRPFSQKEGKKSGRPRKKCIFSSPMYFSSNLKVTATFLKGTLVSSMTYGPLFCVIVKQFTLYSMNTYYDFNLNSFVLYFYVSPYISVLTDVIFFWILQAFFSENALQVFEFCNNKLSIFLPIVYIDHTT